MTTSQTSTADVVTAALDDARAAGVFDALDVLFAEMLARRARLGDPTLVVAIALAAKAVRLEHVCLSLDDESVASLWRSDEEEVGLPVPATSSLRAALRNASDVVEVVDEGADVDEDGGAPVVLSGERLYLRRYAILEQHVAERLRTSTVTLAPIGLDDALTSVASRLDDRQLLSVRRALSSSISVIAGGPGTGKTTAIAAIVEAACSLVEPLAVALVAPTGKAASRLDEAVRPIHERFEGIDVPQARTIHSLLGIGRDGITRGKPIDVDLLVVDEASMVSLPLLAQVLDAVGPESRVVLVGDPDQLASIEVGAVLADVVAAAANDHRVIVTTLATAHRFVDGADVAVLADAVGTGSPAAVRAAFDGGGDLSLLRADDPAFRSLVDRVVDHAAALVVAARRGDVGTAIDLVGSLGLLCGTKRGRGSTDWWRRVIESRLIARGVLRARDVDYVGRPLLVTRNDALTGLTNGMTGVVVADGDERRAAFEVGTFGLSAVPWAETAWALTIHKAQGSEFTDVLVSLPGPENRVLTRELLYTAVTRAKRSVTLVAPEGSLETAIARRVSRSSGLVARLHADDAAPTR